VDVPLLDPLAAALAARSALRFCLAREDMLMIDGGKMVTGWVTLLIFYFQGREKLENNFFFVW
jgi:hypothetical protein